MSSGFPRPAETGVTRPPSMHERIIQTLEGLPERYPPWGLARFDEEQGILVPIGDDYTPSGSISERYDDFCFYDWVAFSCSVGEILRLEDSWDDWLLAQKAKKSPAGLTVMKRLVACATMHYKADCLSQSRYATYEELEDIVMSSLGLLYDISRLPDKKAEGEVASHFESLIGLNRPDDDKLNVWPADLELTRTPGFLFTVTDIARVELDKLLDEKGAKVTRCPFGYDYERILRIVLNRAAAIPWLIPRDLAEINREVTANLGLR